MTVVQVFLTLNERDFLSVTTESVRNVPTSPQHLLKPASYSHHSSFQMVVLKRVKEPGLHYGTTRNEKNLLALKLKSYIHSGIQYKGMAHMHYAAVYKWTKGSGI